MHADGAGALDERGQTGTRRPAERVYACGSLRPQVAAASTARQKPDLRANLERILKETAKQAKKSKAAFDSTLKPEKIEGENGERTAINFTWTGAGAGTGQNLALRDVQPGRGRAGHRHGERSGADCDVASQLFATFHDHAIDGYDRWALYDLQIDVPEDFRLEEQKLLSGHLHLAWGEAASASCWIGGDWRT